MAEFQAGEVVVPVVPDASLFAKRLRKQLLADAYQTGEAISKDIKRGIADGLQGVYQPFQEQTRQQRQRAPKDGDEVAGAFARGFKARMQTAFRSLPKVEIDADSSQAQVRLQELRARMAALSGKTVGVDLDAGAALAEIEVLDRELRTLDGKDVAADVRVDIASALAALAAIRAEVDALDGRTARARVDVDVSGALGAVRTLGVALAGLAAIPVGASLGAGLASLAGPLAAAGAGLGALAAVAGPSLSRINDALKEQEKAGQQAASGLSAAAGATRNLAVEAAQAQIAQLQAVNAADQLRSAQDRLKDAYAGVIEAQDRVRSAVSAAASVQATAAARVAAAERSLADSQRTALQAQQALNQARQDAIRTMEDISRSLRGNALDQREAALDLDAAQAQLKKAQARGNAKEIEKASIAYERAKLRVEELKAQEEDLQKQQAKGVEGQDAVVSAKQQLESANQRVLDQERALAEAYAASGKAGEEAAQRVAEARKAVAEAESKVDDAKRALEGVKRQQKIAQLQEKIRKEQAKDAARAAAASTARSAAGVATKDPFKDLSPSAKAAAKSIAAAKKAYESWQKSLEPNVLPVITRGLGLIQKTFKPLTPIIRGSSVALLGLERDANKALGGKFWKDFFQQLSSAAPKAIYGFGKAAGSVFTGIAGVIKAFLPYTGDIVDGIQKGAARFAAWGKSLGSSSGFQSFIAYARENGPKVIAVVKNLFTVAKNLLTGLSGSGSGALDMIVAITGKLATFSPDTLRNIALAALGVTAAFKAWKVISTTIDGVKKAVQIVGDVKTAWGKFRTAASSAWDMAKKAGSGIARAAKAAGRGAGKAGTAVWSGIRTAAAKAASVAKTSATAIAGAAKTAGSAAARGGAAAWNGIRVAAQKAGSAAKTAGSAIVTAGKTAATAALSLGRVAVEYGKVAVQAALARAKQLLFAAAQGVVRGATLLWAAAQRILNVVLSLNPIGLIVTAIGLLAGAVVFLWNKFPPFRQAVEAAWQGIQTAISWAWTNVIQPAFQAIWGFITNTLAPIFTWLWNNVIVPAWQGISAAIKWAWDNVILPVVKGGYVFFKTVLAPVFSWLWNTIIKPAFDGIGKIIKFAWENVIKPALNGWQQFFKTVLGPAVTWLWKNIIVPAWDGIKLAITTVWDKFLKPVFDKLYDVIFKTIPDGFKKGVDLIKTAWDKVRDAAKKPVEFIINTVWNNGIVKVWNAAADALGIKTKLSPIAFAKGGVYPGYTPGKDIGLAAVSGGEAIMRPEWTRAVGENYVHGANAAARSGGVAGVARFLGVAGDPGRFMGAFAGGGIVDDIKGALAGGIKLGAEKLLNPLLDQAASAMGDSQWGRMLVGVPKTIVKNVIDYLGKKEGNGGAAVSYARQQIGKPYQWGATGPGSFDCSGLTMRAWQAAGVGDIPRTSEQQYSWVKPVSSPLPGDLGFPHTGHVWLYSSNGKIIESPHTGANVREVAARAAVRIGRPPQLFDQGGYLPTGHSLVYNGTGRPEPVLTNAQWANLMDGTSGGSSRDRAMVNVENMQVREQADINRVAGELLWRSKAGG